MHIQIVKYHRSLARGHKKTLVSFSQPRVFYYSSEGFRLTQAFQYLKDLRHKIFLLRIIDAQHGY